jgi:hypothetical protein
MSFRLHVRLKAILLAATLGAGSGSALADQASPASAVPQLDFSPPPVPEFMLRKPDHPLTLEEMKAQADAAAERARAGKLQQDTMEKK